MSPFERWRHIIQQARDESAVIQVVREYLSTWLPSDLQKLPDSCRDLVFNDADELLGLAVRLTTCELKFMGERDAREILVDLTRTFVIAAIRIGQLRPGPMGAAAPVDGT